MLSIYAWEAIPHHIFIFGSILVPHSNVCTFIKRLTTYSTYTHFILKVLVSSYLSYIYICTWWITSLHKLGKHHGAAPKISRWPKGKSLSQCLRFYAFLYSKPKAWIPRSNCLIWALILTYIFLVLATWLPQ